MALCSYADDSEMLGVTNVNNLFILENLPSAPGDYVKVYLYGLMACRFPSLCDSLEKMSETLHIDIQTVKNALSYWHREGLVDQISDNPPAYCFFDPSSSRSSEEKGDDDGVYQNRSYYRELHTLMPGLILEGHELGMANDWIDVYGLSKEAALLLVKTEVEKRGGHLPGTRTMFKQLNDAAENWAENGVTDLESAQKYLLRSSVCNSAARAVLKQFGQRRQPSVDELRLVKKWVEEWGFSQDDLIRACEKTVNGETPSFGYLDKILASQKNEPNPADREQVKKLINHLGIASRPTPAMLEALARFSSMGFDFDVIEEAARWCSQNNRRTFEELEKRLEKWKELGISTLADVEQERSAQKHYSELLEKVYEECALDRRVSAGDIKLIRLWTALIPADAVLYGATLARGAENPLKYIDKLIKTWSANGLNTLDKIKSQSDELKIAARPAASQKKPMDERTVDPDEFKQDYSELMNRKRSGE
ncbi:MAG: DnaD domain protein [Clostridiales bacterium]|nr:DnaD domain protein [Clostridiales bacterium]